jgi:hypothetical protein
VLAVLWPAPAHAREADHGRVLVVTYPGLRWEEVLEHRPPALTRLLRQSAVASMSVRTIGPITSLGEAYATIGAGNRATAEDAFAGQVYPPQASVEGDIAVDVFARRCACSGRAMSVLHLGMPRVERSNDRLLYGAMPGALGEAVADAGGRTAVVANADRAIDAVADQVHREAALAVVDEHGRAPLGNVGPGLVMADPSAPYGLRTSVQAATDAVRAAWDGADVLLLEMSDLDRADRYSDLATEAATEAARAAALARADELLDAALAGVDLARDLVIVVGPTSPRGPAQLTVAAMGGRGVEPGLARSATTRRDGFVTLPDVAPTVLDFLGIDVPDDMTGTTMRSSGGGVSDADLRALADDNEIAQFRDKATGPASVTFIVLQVVGYGLAALALTRWRRARPWVAWFLLVPLAQAPLAFLSGLVRYDALTVPGYVVVHVAAGIALAGLALLAARALRTRAGDAAMLVAPLSLISLTVVVLVVDVLAGGPLQLNTVFGYSPTVAGRFAGFGNLAFALLAATSIVAVTGAWSAASLKARARAPRRRTLGLALIALAMAVVVVADGLPSLGSDVGGVLALVPAATVVVLLLAGVRMSWTRVALIAFGTGAVLLTFALLDLARPEDDRTHLGRLAAKVLHADNGGVSTVLRRKVEANVGILTSSVWTWVIPIAIAFLSFLVWRRPGSLRAVEERVPGLRAGLIGSLVAAIVGFALNDSGIAVPAMMLAVVLPYVAFLIVETAD